ncbi:hypothetical protein AAA799E16_01595 [Marine Group I thaumarchaeote SCGC AAA799-E16]|uniref:Uncharacterized protein n=5 Tax=Marine Group I TaxID=905826 RepID=A0A087S662_9ARCH|nr:hypothetical protein AAA799N04_01416 [Marine Group I thaumarchaeote SCGC AAA799-N04]KER05721.1 hypothetical protein AAA799E16_01595 [Marine Group I thaumarchaeote SCGC AAA799-E16]KFM16396.1 hypothetical protein AAA799D11_00685 [Marine Group I thaumarchaeote SCGC AAA799-D11]KFM18285.1 hypothetical protein SCCGRSA3_01204 [Marine Group I thaumarchaeote SCGC RSA3]KFM21216.1 hypothetical protein AAA799B03_01256 [Marine Group I thaumarchaeote SCGC AAA799-B03]
MVKNGKLNTKNLFDPDELVLTKSEILEFCDRVIKKWNKNPTKNAKNILAMNAVKTSVLWTDDESLKAIWSEIIAWTFELLYENAMAKDEEWANMLKKLKNKK